MLGTEWLVPEWPAPAHVRAVFTTRAGGVSLAPFDSFNLGDHVGDVPEAVAANRQRLADRRRTALHRARAVKHLHCPADLGGGFLDAHFWQALLDRLLAARNFQSGLMTLRQLEFSIFDLEIHRRADIDFAAMLRVLDEVRDTTSLLRPPAWNRFPCSFTHIFAGGYAAGYYSYKWAEVLSADAFSAFEREGVFNADTGRRFRQAILAQGGSRPAAELFREFMGRDPSPEALLRHSGLLDAAA